jgi:hypothetical protein
MPYRDVIMIIFGEELKMVNVKFSLCLIKQHAMKTYSGVEIYFLALYVFALHGDVRTGSRFGRCTPGSPWIGDQVGSIADQDAWRAEKSFPRRKLSPDSLVFQPIA